jgi:hypothetical protein
MIRRLCPEALEERAMLPTFIITNMLDYGSVGSLRWAVKPLNADKADIRANTSHGGNTKSTSTAPAGTCATPC